MENKSKLDVAREKINEIDRQMCELFLERMDAVRMVAEHKIEHALPIFDAKRESDIIAKNSQAVEDAELREYYVRFIQNNMSISRAYQERLISGMKIAYSGITGAYANIAARKIFKDATYVSCTDFKSAYDSVVNGECDCAVLPIENSTAGEVGAVLDMMFSGSLCVSGVYDLFITHNLVAKKGTKISDIKEVVSHPQALAQCSPYIRKMGFSTHEAENTARAARFVAENDSFEVAAIASEETAELYGLEVLARSVNEKNINTTRFATFVRARESAVGDESKHSILMFTAKNVAGSLAEAINVIGKNGYNMRCLRSRPMKELLWQYYFYVETEGNLDTKRGRKMIEELSSMCDMVKVIGSFDYPSELR